MSEKLATPLLQPSARDTKTASAWARRHRDTIHSDLKRTVEQFKNGEAIELDPRDPFAILEGGAPARNRKT